MLRLASLLVVFAACGGSGFDTGAATLTGIQPTIKSSGANSFTQADGSGTMVLGWTVFFSDGVGADCLSKDVKTVANIGIFTNQQPDATHKKAMLATDDNVVIVAMSPPTVSGTAAATMGVAGIANIVGTVTIDAFHLKPDGTADRIDGTVNAGGTDPMGGAGVSINGTFMAPICE